ncbi:MAG: phosphomannomutase/phosphoglucomutase [Patescibacteria group bacterium]
MGKEIPSEIFRSYDIRGLYPFQLDEKLAYRIAQAYVKYVQPEGKIVVGYDVRTSSPKLQESVISGLTDAGIDVVNIGMVSTDMYYFAAGNYNYAGGIMITASHNPAEYNGLKMVRENVYPLFGEEGINQIRDMILNNEEKIKSENTGITENKDVLNDFSDFVQGLIDVDSVKPLKVVMNANFGYQAVVADHIIKRAKLPITLVGLNDQPDGTFPKGRPDPYVPENRPEFVELVKSENADFGVAWDADGDRVFFCTGNGVFVDAYYINSLLIKEMLAKSDDKNIIYEPRYTWAIIDAAKEAGGNAIAERVGHSYIKARMKKENAIFCGESSGHTYFRDFWYADAGMIPFILMLEIISKSGKSLDDLIMPIINKYPISGEINSTVDDKDAVLSEIRETYSDAEFNTLDGLSLEYPDWRANIRASNTEPLLRLNVEAKTKELVEDKTQELLNIIRS